MSWSTSELRVRLAPLNRFKPSSKIFYWPFQGGTSFVDLLCFCSVLCLLCLCARLFICALWWPAGKGLTSCLWCLLWVCHFPIGILGKVWYLIVSIPDLCTLTYFIYRKHWGPDGSFRRCFCSRKRCVWLWRCGGGMTFESLESTQVRNNCFHVDNMKELFQDIHIDSIMTFLRQINLFNKI